MNGRVQLWGHHIAVDWAEPELEVDEEIMAQVRGERGREGGREGSGILQKLQWIKVRKIRLLQAHGGLILYL